MPAEVRKRLEVGPGSVLEWDEQNNQIIVRRAGRYTSEDVHRALFPSKPPKKAPVDVKDAVRTYIRKRHAHLTDHPLEGLEGVFGVVTLPRGKGSLREKVRRRLGAKNGNRRRRTT